MINAAILYPNTAGSWFDAAYYVQRHVPMSIGLLSAHRGYRGVSVELGLGGGEPGTDAPFVAMCTYRFDSIPNFVSAFARHEDALRADMRSYTDIDPIIQINDVAIAGSTGTDDPGLGPSQASSAPLMGLGGLRFARASFSFDETVRFYRDLVGLSLRETFEDSFGSTGAIFALPGASLTFELVRVDEPIEAHAHEQLCLYFPDERARDAATARLREAGLVPQAEQHPYWAATGAVTFLDPDGRDVIFAPFVYGRNEPPGP
ncbi:MAG TPA: EthD family reductase [Candidatus Limnocylindrales bacterium]|nr:EthD family reductase [Candidatus Limnocylindrales bacterium]